MRAPRTRTRARLVGASAATVLSAASAAYQLLARREPVSLVALVGVAALGGLAALTWGAAIYYAVRARRSPS